jgi:hypothetical protein
VHRLLSAGYSALRDRLHNRNNADQSIEIEDVLYGGTPKSKRYSAARIAKQRITSARIFNYETTPA